MEKGINFIGRTFENNGIQGVIEKRDFEPNRPFTITATVIGNYKYAKYQKEAYYCSQNINKLTPKKILLKHWNEKIAYFFVTYIQKFISLYDGQQGGYKLDDIKNHKVFIPQKNADIDFEFMENFISQLEAFRLSQLEAYLLVTGLKDYTLTTAEEQALADFQNGKIQWGTYRFEEIFDNIKQGRRLKKDDQIAGDIPFVMAGVTNTGVVNYISNPVASFPKNSITIDIFGNAFYRNYDFGAGDDTGVYWNAKTELSKEVMLFLTKASEKALEGKFSYGKKLRSSQSLKLQMMLPTQNNTPDYDYMALLISAIQKLVIKDVVLYADRKIEATRQVVERD